MQIQSVNNNNNFHTNFKGSVSPEFVKYVNALRNDCLASVPKSSNLINNVCDNIINRATRIMKNCFPDSYTLSIGKEQSKGLKVSMENSILKKHIPEIPPITVLTSINRSPSPLYNLLHLNRGIKGSGCYIFTDGYAKSLIPISSIIEFGIDSKNINMHTNKDMRNDFKNILLWWRNNINLLRAESPKEYTKDIFRDCEMHCDRFLSLLKQCEN